MRNAAAVLGIIAGILALIVGFVSYGWTEAVARNPAVGEVFGNFLNPGFVRAVAIAGPILAIAGGAMARVRALWGGVCLLLAAALFWAAFGINLATIFPITMAAAAGVLALAAGRPDEPKAHF